MNSEVIKNGQLMPAELTRQIREKYHHVDTEQS